MVTVVNSMIYLKVAKKVDLKSSQNKEEKCNCVVVDVNYT